MRLPFFKSDLKFKSQPDFKHTEPVIWFHFSTIPPEITGYDLENIFDIIQQFFDRKEQVTFVITGIDAPDNFQNDRIFFIPDLLYLSFDRFIETYRPIGLFWIGGALDQKLIFSANKHNIFSILLCPPKASLKPSASFWFPGLRRRIIRKFNLIFVSEKADYINFLKSGVIRQNIVNLPDFVPKIKVQKINKTERDEILSLIGLRPLWFAVNVPLQELKAVVKAHQQASLRSHRLMLIITPDNKENIKVFYKILNSAGIHTVSCHSEIDINSNTNVLLIDNKDETDLWYSLCPITYMGGSFSDHTRHPFEALNLGSAIIHGPRTAPYKIDFENLNETGGSYLITDINQLGSAVESMLSVDKTALSITKAWSLTTRGAERLHEITDIIQNLIDNNELNHA